MKRAVISSFFIFVFCVSILSQKMTEPKLLGSLIAGEDPSEFLLHDVMERSEIYLKDNPEGQLIVRICGSDDFSTAFIKAAFNPLAASNYNVFIKRIIVPYEKIFIAKSSKCLGKENIVFTEHWFVPDKNTLEYDEILPVNDILYRAYYIDDYDLKSGKNKSKTTKEEQFAENITEFVAKLKNDPNGQGFIVHNSKNKAIKRNIEKVKARLEKENIGLQRVKIVIKVRMDIDKNAKLVPIKDEKKYFPDLELVTIKK